ncbi:hypothetical protein BDY21DRAFT_349512 [Lineolata rhizophorae]|uniref:Uncharacterized protein n=1 Tax=Lineolata rhizophorae TaxID=578093 RepID=A0A6A6NUP9_9PEZI|nr:hypothetical protein BDY21DRAFT_349512 [Lineolata rhizophorae]
MAPRDDDKKPDRPINPFLAFRDLVDEHVSSMLQSVIGLPSAITRQPSHSQWMDQNYPRDNAKSASGAAEQRKPDGGDNGSKETADAPTMPIEEWNRHAEGIREIMRQFWGRSDNEERDLFDKKVRERREQMKKFFEERRAGRSGAAVESSGDTCPYGPASPAQAERAHQRVEKMGEIWDDAAVPGNQREGVEEDSKNDRDGHGKEYVYCFDNFPARFGFQIEDPHTAFHSLWTDPFLDISSRFPISSRVYLSRSLYSPLWLEQHPVYGAQGARWRAAFEDLVKEEGGEVARPSTQNGEVESPHDWLMRVGKKPVGSDGDILGSYLTGIFNDLRDKYFDPTLPSIFDRASQEDRSQVPHAHHNEDTDPDTSADEYPDTELDMYERLLDLQTSASADSTVASTSKTTSSSYSYSSETTSAEGKPSILSELTTTTRELQPDGSMKTTTVLRKRFADGREENSETVHTTPAQNRKQIEAAALPPVEDRSVQTQAVEPQRPTDGSEGNKSQQKKNNGNRGGGWFWSG